MKNPVFPTAPWLTQAGESVDLENADDIINIARQLIDGEHPGVLTTVDEEGRPHTRWMATFAFDDFPVMRTLTSPHSQKLNHLTANPHVEWMFSNQDLSLILNFAGTARVIRDPGELKRIWQMVGDKSHAYFMKNFNEGPGFAVLETTVEHIHCSVPASNFQWTVTVRDLMKTG